MAEGADAAVVVAAAVVLAAVCRATREAEAALRRAARAAAENLAMVMGVRQNASCDTGRVRVDVPGAVQVRG